MREGQLRDYEARLGKSFEHEGYQEELQVLRDKLRLGLSEKPPEGGEPVAELAGKIKALREANTDEAAPERTMRRAARAERPVTARIRERLVTVEPAKEEPRAVEVKPEPVQVAEPVVAEPQRAEILPMPELVKHADDSDAMPASVAASTAGFRQRVAGARKGDGRQMTLF